MKNTQKKFLSFSFFMCVMMSRLTHAQVAQFERIIGNVKIKRLENEKEVFKKDLSGEEAIAFELLEGDILETGNESRALLRLLRDPGTRLVLGPRSRLILKNSPPAQRESPGRHILRLEQGQALNDLPQKKPRLFELETPNAVLGVRGTQFYVNVDPKSLRSEIYVERGQLEIFTREEQKGVEIKEKQVAIVEGEANQGYFLVKPQSVIQISKKNEPKDFLFLQKASRELARELDRKDQSSSGDTNLTPAPQKSETKNLSSSKDRPKNYTPKEATNHPKNLHR